VRVSSHRRQFSLRRLLVGLDFVAICEQRWLLLTELSAIQTSAVGALLVDDAAAIETARGGELNI